MPDGGDYRVRFRYQGRDEWLPRDWDLCLEMRNGIVLDAYVLRLGYRLSIDQAIAERDVATTTSNPGLRSPNR